MPHIEVVRVREDRLGRAHTGEVISPLSRSGAPFHYLLRKDRWWYFADSAQGLLPVIIGGYPVLPGGPSPVDPEQTQLIEDEDRDGLGARRRELRIRHANAVRGWRQAEVLFDAEGQGPVEPAARRVLLAPGNIPPVLAEPWTHEVPLLLVEVDYRPFTDRPCPMGNIFWLRPMTADGYLHSLGAIGAISLASRP